MKLYAPTTTEGKQVKLPMQFWPYKLNCLWPLSYGSPRSHEQIITCVSVLLYLNYMPTIVAESVAMTSSGSDVITISEGLCTTLVGVQCVVRIYHLITSRHQFRHVLRNFYKDIYVDSSEDKKLHDSCQRTLFRLYLATSSFLLPLFFMFMGVVVVVAQDPSSRSKPFFYRMRFFYDAQDPWAYALTTLYTGWVGCSSATLMCAEDSFLGTLLCYSAVRYELLHKELEELYESSLQALAMMSQPPPANALHHIFITKLRTIVQKQQLLDKFSAEMQDYVSTIVFALVTFGVFLLCVIAFMLAKTDFSMGTFKYFVWLMCQNFEFMLIGSLAQRYTDGATQMANSFYMCNWESLLPHGSAEANSRLIKNISFAIYRSQKSVHVDGLKFFTLSMNSIGSAVSSSVSYFMFLNTMEDVTNKKNSN